MIDGTRARTGRALHVNVFCHARPAQDTAREQAYIERFRPELARFGCAAPDVLREIYPSFLGNDPMLELLVDKRPEVVSFHFGLPEKTAVEQLRSAGCVLLASATYCDVSTSKSPPAPR